MNAHDPESPEAERAYCKRLMEKLVEYELDPRNFTKTMRARNQFRSPYLSRPSTDTWPGTRS